MTIVQTMVLSQNLIQCFKNIQHKKRTEFKQPGKTINDKRLNDSPLAKSGPMHRELSP